jgi:hypothetical protein
LKPPDENGRVGLKLRNRRPSSSWRHIGRQPW